MAIYKTVLDKKFGSMFCGNFLFSQVAFLWLLKSPLKSNQKTDIIHSYPQPNKSPEDEIRHSYGFYQAELLKLYFIGSISQVELPVVDWQGRIRWARLAG